MFLNLKVLKSDKVKIIEYMNIIIHLFLYAMYYILFDILIKVFVIDYKKYYNSSCTKKIKNKKKHFK